MLGNSINRSPFKLFVIPCLTFNQYGTLLAMSANTMLSNKYAKSSDEEVKKDLLLTKPNSYSLSKLKLVHSRDNVNCDTLIVRDTWNKARLNKFGVKGIANIQNIYYGMLALLHEHRDDILPKLKYDADELVILLESLTEKDIANIDNWSKVEKNNVENKFQVNYIDGKVQRIELLQIKEDETMVNGVRLFIAEAIKLIQYINHHHFIPEEGQPRFNEWSDRRAANKLYQRVQAHEEDNFF